MSRCVYIDFHERVCNFGHVFYIIYVLVWKTPWMWSGVVISHVSVFVYFSSLKLHIYSAVQLVCAWVCVCCVCLSSGFLLQPSCKIPWLFQDVPQLNQSTSVTFKNVLPLWFLKDSTFKFPCRMRKKSLKPPASVSLVWSCDTHAALPLIIS